MRRRIPFLSRALKLMSPMVADPEVSVCSHEDRLVSHIEGLKIELAVADETARAAAKRANRLERALRTELSIASAYRGASGIEATRASAACIRMATALSVMGVTRVTQDVNGVHNRS